jgi:hypothetical protein
MSSLIHNNDINTKMKNKTPRETGVYIFKTHQSYKGGSTGYHYQ